MSNRENEILHTQQENETASVDHAPVKKERRGGTRFKDEAAKPADKGDDLVLPVSESFVPKSASRLDDNEDDYVIPPSSKRSHHHRHHHHHSESEESDFVFSHHDYHRKKSKKSVALKVLLTILIAVLAVIIATGATYVVLRQIGDNQLHNYEEVELVMPDDSEHLKDTPVEVQSDGKTIHYNGETYLLNEKVATVAFIGVDQSLEDSDKKMSDAIYLAAIDSAMKKVTIISVSRDTMADVDVYSSEGRYIDTEKMQLSYAYSFDNEKVNGAKNTTAAVSKLFFGLPFNNYFALDMNALISLNDAIGGVPVTSLMTFTSPEDGSTIYEGEEVVLRGKEAEAYVRSRDITELESNNDRMARQQQYIKAFLASVIPAAKNDLSVVSKLYNTVSDNSVTSLTLPQITYLASDALSLVSDSSEIEFRGIKGEIKAGDHAELYVDDKALLEQMLDIFYIKT